MEYSQKSTAEKELHHKKVDDYNEPALDLYIIDLTWRRRSLSLSLDPSCSRSATE